LALLGGASERVAQLMEGNLLSIVSSSELAVLNQLLRSIPMDIASNPWLKLASAWGMAYVWQFDVAESLLENVLSNLINFDDHTQARIRGRILTLRSYLAGSKRDYPNSIRIAQEALKFLPQDDLSMRSFTLLIIGNAYRFTGDSELAIQFHNDALHHSELASDGLLSVIILARLIDIYRITGSLNRAYQVGKYAVEIIEGYQPQKRAQSFILGYLNLRLCTVYYERNDLGPALHFAEIGLDLIRQWGAYDSTSVGYINLARIYMAYGNYSQAMNCLHEFKETYPAEARLQFKIASAVEAEIDLHAGNLQRSSDWLESCGFSQTRKFQVETFQIYDAIAQILITRGQIVDAQELLESLLVYASETGAAEYVMRARGKLAIILQATGQEEAALNMLRDALDQAAPEGYKRVFLDQSQPMAQLLYRAASRGIQPEFCKQLLVEFSTATQTVSELQGELIEPLTDREIEVLRHIAQGSTNQEIAQQLVLSLFTIKSHARNIYSKLAVKNRTEAVAKARLLGLLPLD
jgi:LuxR family maltose regulon positive regulatory protein